jgi:hypothetical protein
VIGLESSGGPTVRKQFVELLDGVRSDSREYIPKPGERVHVGQLSGCDEASQHGHGPAAAVASYERPVVAADCDAPQGPLCMIVIDR